MASLIDETPDAAAWVERTLGGMPNANNPRRLATAVIWPDSYLPDDEPIGGNDPPSIVDEINEEGLPLLHGHDPGRPAGRFITAHAFTSPSGTRFVAAILAYYEPESLLSFASCGVIPLPAAALPAALGLPIGARIELAADPRNVPEQPWTTRRAIALHQGPIGVPLAVLDSIAAPHTHEANLAHRPGPRKRVSLHYTPLPRPATTPQKIRL